MKNQFIFALSKANFVRDDSLRENSDLYGETGCVGENGESGHERFLVVIKRVKK